MGGDDELARVSDREMFRYLVDGISDYSIYLLSTAGVVSSWNTGARQIKGYDSSEIVGRNFGVFFTETDRANGEPERILRAATENGRLETQGWRVRKDGTQFWAHVVVNSVHDNDGALIGFAKITRDVTQQKQAEAALQRLARFDTLTALPNRASFFDTVTGWIDDGEAPTRLAIALIDLDQFKQINDAYGHPTGDFVLAARARQLLALQRRGLVVARLGGDEFVAAFRFERVGELVEFLNTLETIFQSPLRLNDVEVSASASIGVALRPENGATIEDLLSNADIAMYRSKKSVPRRATIFHAELDDLLKAQRTLSTEMLDAIHGGQLRVLYQDQRSLHDGSLVGREALVRWEHPTRGQLAPDVFIPVAEATGAITELGRWVLNRACTDAAAWAPGVRVAVNASALELADPGWFNEVRNALHQSGLHPSLLEIEITESTFVKDTPLALDMLNQVKNLGVSIALDDFGAGYSSLETLLAYPFDRIKIDKSFIRGSTSHTKTRAVLRAVLSLGHAIPATVLVEGVETEQQLTFLHEEGFDEAQGFYIGRPTGNNPASPG